MSDADGSKPEHNPKREHLAQLIAAGGTSVDKCYVAAGYRPDHSNAHRVAKRLAPRIEWLKRQAADKATTHMAAGVAHQVATTAYVTQKIVEALQMAMGERPFKKRVKVIKSGKEVLETQDVFEFRPGAALRAAHLLGLDLGMFKTENAPPPPADLEAVRSISDPKVAEQLKRYASGKPRLIAVDGKVKKGAA